MFFNQLLECREKQNPYRVFFFVIGVFALVFFGLIHPPTAVFGSEWAAMESGTTEGLYDVWGTSVTDVFAVGENGTILRYNGTSWSAMDSGTTEKLYGIWGSSNTDIYAVGNEIALHFDGSTWSVLSGVTSNPFYDVWGSSSTDVFAVGNDIHHYDGTGWSEEAASHFLRGVWGFSGDDVYVVGNHHSYGEGYVRHYNGAEWSSSRTLTDDYLVGVWGSSETDVFAIGAGENPYCQYNGSLIFHYNGTTWSKMDLEPVCRPLYGVWGSSGTDVFAVGNTGTILHYDGAGWAAMNSGVTYALRGIWGASGADVFAVGDGGTILRFGDTGASPDPSNTCSASNLSACMDSGACTNVGGYWCNELCQAEQCETSDTCSNTPSLCENQSECESAGWSWCNEECQFESCETYSNCAVVETDSLDFEVKQADFGGACVYFKMIANETKTIWEVRPGSIGTCDCPTESCAVDCAVVETDNLDFEVKQADFGGACVYFKMIANEAKTGWTLRPGSVGICTGE